MVHHADLHETIKKNYFQPLICALKNLTYLATCEGLKVHFQILHNFKTMMNVYLCYDVYLCYNLISNLAHLSLNYVLKTVHIVILKVPVNDHTVLVRDA